MHPALTPLPCLLNDALVRLHVYVSVWSGHPFCHMCSSRAPFGQRWALSVLACVAGLASAQLRPVNIAMLVPTGVNSDYGQCARAAEHWEAALVAVVRVRLPAPWARGGGPLVGGARRGGQPSLAPLRRPPTACRALPSRCGSVMAA